MKILKLFYDLCDSEDLRYKTLDERHRKYMKMTLLRSDPALYMLIANGKLIGLSGGYVDDLIRTGSDRFHEVSRKTHESFQMDEDEAVPCEFSNFSLIQDSSGCLLQYLNEYLRKLEKLPFNASSTEFRSMRMRIA